MSIKALEKHIEPLKPFLQTAGVTEVCINQPGLVFVENNGYFTRHEVQILEFSFYFEALSNLIANLTIKHFRILYFQVIYRRVNAYNVLCHLRVKKIMRFILFVATHVMK